MNVKQGDMAIIIKSAAGNEGKIVEVLQYLGEAPVEYDGRKWFNGGEGHLWLCKSFSPLVDTTGGVSFIGPVRDSCMRPVSGLDDSFEEENEKELEGIK